MVRELPALGHARGCLVARQTALLRLLRAWSDSTARAFQVDRHGDSGATACLQAVPHCFWGSSGTPARTTSTPGCFTVADQCRILTCFTIRAASSDTLTGDPSLAGLAGGALVGLLTSESRNPGLLIVPARKKAG